MAHPRYVGLRLSTAAGAVPTAADMAEGELAINTADGRVYTLAGSTIIDLTDRYTTQQIDDLLAGKAAASHTHPWDEVASKPATATRWPVVAEVDGLTAALADKLDAASRYTDAEAVAAMQAAPEWHAADWDAAHGWGDHAMAGYLKSVAWGDVGGKPVFATVATSGAYSDLSGKPSLGTAAPLDVPASGDAAAGEVVKGDDSRLSDARTPTAHTHPWGEVTSKPATATRWPTFVEVASKPATYPPSSHSHTLGEITDAGSAAAEDTSAFDPAGSAAQVEHDIRETLRQTPDPLLMHFL